jgi:hypothetical protein
MLGGVVVVAAVVWWTDVLAGFAAVVCAMTEVVSGPDVSAARRAIEGNFEIIVIPV